MICAIDYEDFEPVFVLLHLMVDPGMERSDIEDAIRKACKEYLQTEEGKGM